MDDCNKFNQYYTDIVDSSGSLVTTKCFDGKIYKEKFNVNSYKNYKSNPYYTWVDDNFKDYAFPQEDYESEDYSPDIAFLDNCESTVYSLKKQQKFAGRIFNTSTEINSMLIYHGLGSGKTQTSIVIGEAFKFRKIDNTIIPNRSESRVFIVVPAALQQQYYSEIIGKYENGIIKSAPGEIWISGNRQYYSSRLIRSRISSNYSEIATLREQKTRESDPRILNQIEADILKLTTSTKDLQISENVNVTKIYEIISHEAFLNKLFKIENGVYKEQEYLKRLKEPGGLLIIDEIQNLVSATGTNYRRLLYALRNYAHPKFRCIFLTGTPIYDKPYEFGLLINLLRPRVVFPDGRDAFNEVFLNQNLEFINQDSFKKMCSGYVSYFKGGNPIAYPYKKTTLMYHRMEEYQYNNYKDALIKEVLKDQKLRLKDEEFFTHQKDDKVSTGIFNNSNQFCNIVYPKLSVTKGDLDVLEQNIAEFRKLLSAEKKRIGSLPLEEQNQKILKMVIPHSSKFAKVADMITKCEGSVFVFSNYVYYGVDAMGVIMENLGYAAYPLRGPLGSYFVWKGEANKTPDLVKRANKAFNDPRNIDGSLLKVMFGTQTVMEGVDFKNVNQIHILDPWWNDSRMQQVIARGIRYCSHKNLPPERRTVDVFIHISTMGTFEKVFDLKIIEGGVERKIKSFLQIENRAEKDSNKWVFFEAYTRVDQEHNAIIQNSKKTFKGSQIVSGSIVRSADQALNGEFGNWKQLDSRSVQEYMYNRSLQKLSINRQFEKVIKETAIDCSINKNGNVVRLNEIYTPNNFIDNTWILSYENYSTGERYTRLNVKSAFLPDLPDNVFTLDDILVGTAKSSSTFIFKNEAGEEKKINKSLIVSENIDCAKVDYSFVFPDVIKNLTINKELLPFLFKMNKLKILTFFNNVQYNPSFRATYIKDPKLAQKLKVFMSKKVSVERQKYIDALKELGFEGDDLLWDQYTLEQIKAVHKEFVKNKVYK